MKTKEENGKEGINKRNKLMALQNLRSTRGLTLCLHDINIGFPRCRGRERVQEGSALTHLLHLKFYSCITSPLVKRMAFAILEEYRGIKFLHVVRTYQYPITFHEKRFTRILESILTRNKTGTRVRSFAEAFIFKWVVDKKFLV